MAQTSRVFDESPSAARGRRRLGDGFAAAYGVVGILVLLLCSNLALYGQAPAPATNTAPAAAATATNTPAPPSPDPAEEARAFEAARRAFQDGNHASAEKFFLEFRQRFPQSERFAEAMLYQARSLLRMERRDEAISLLGAAGKVGGRFEDEILYWHGEALQQKGDHLGAATQFARLLATQTNSARRLEAAYSEARAHFKLEAWKRVAELLGDGAGAFQQAARGRPADELASLGRLLLADALVQLRDFASAESETRKLDSNALTPDLRWRKERLLYEVLALGGKFAEALVQSSNAVVAAVATGSPALSAEAVELQGTACQRMNRWDEAVAAFERNLADPAPAPRQRAALLQLVQIHLSRGQFQLATQRLDALVVRNPAGSPNDAALLAYGELFLRAHAISAQGGVVPLGLSKSNLLQEAAGRFDQVVRLQPASPLAGRAHLNLGWTSWAQERFPESVESFRTAAATLPFSEDQAVAVFKMGETLARMRDYTNAILTLQDFTNRFSALPRAANSLMDQALIHLVRLHSETRNLAAAQVALERLLAWSPESSLVDSSLLYLGNRLSLLDEPQQARALLSKVSDASPSKPVAELAVARTYGQQGLWTNAMLGYSNWIARFPAQSNLMPQAEYDLAWATFRSGAETNAYGLFSRFLEQHPLHARAPHAQYWIGEHYFRQQNYTNAEIQFRRIYQNTNWPVSELTYEAKMQEGRAAFARQGFNNAQELFTQILNAQPPYPGLVADAFFAYGDCLMMQASISTNAFARYEEASTAYRTITRNFPTNAVTPKAWGSLGNCLLQLAQQDPAFYTTEATNAYQQVLNHPLASVQDRSQAEIGIALALKKRAESLPSLSDRTLLLEKALYHLHRVLYGNNLHAGEVAHPFWLKKAGLESAQTAEALQNWDAALGTYSRLRELLPQLAPDLDRRIARARAAKTGETRPAQ